MKLTAYEKKVSVIFGVAFILMIVSALVTLNGCGASGPEPEHPYTHEYEPGQSGSIGSVDVEKFTKMDSRFAIGANEEGYAVFKDPQAAFEAVQEKCPDGIALIRKECKENDGYDPGEFSRDNYSMYGEIGCQVTSGSQEEKDQAFFVTDFVDIYENSFDEKSPNELY